MTVHPTSCGHWYEADDRGRLYKPDPGQKGRCATVSCLDEGSTQNIRLSSSLTWKCHGWTYIHRKHDAKGASELDAEDLR